MMEVAELTSRIVALLGGVDVVVADGDSFFFYDPRDGRPVDRRFPFATIVTKDNDFDHASNLNREGVFRLNVGLSKQSFIARFGTPAMSVEEAVAAGHDFTTLDRVMPHPMYGRMYWACVLNPTEATFESLRLLLIDAYDVAGRRYRSPTSGDA